MGNGILEFGSRSHHSEYHGVGHDQSNRGERKVIDRCVGTIRQQHMDKTRRQRPRVRAFKPPGHISYRRTFQRGFQASIPATVPRYRPARVSLGGRSTNGAREEPRPAIVDPSNEVQSLAGRHTSDHQPVDGREKTPVHESGASVRFPIESRASLSLGWRIICDSAGWLPCPADDPGKRFQLAPCRVLFE